MSSIPSSILANLKNWVEQALIDQSIPRQKRPLDWQPLTGDAGFRKYIRVGLDAGSLMAVYSPPDLEKNHEFYSIDQFLYSNGLHVPKILAHDFTQGFFLIEDLGEELYLPHLNEETVNTLYGEALFALLRIQQCPKDHDIFPLYDSEQLNVEMGLFPEWFVEKLLGHSLTQSEKQLLANTFSILERSALDQPQVIVHRDFHSRNIVYGAGGSPGIIDFQDAVIGPITYDLVSLLRDCYIEWPEDQVKRWALAYGNMALDAGILSVVSEDQFLKWFDLMGLQRHIKVMGIFARLSLRDGKHGYLDDLPLVIRYVRRVCQQHTDMLPFLQWYDETLLPRIKKQAWFQA